MVTAKKFLLIQRFSGMPKLSDFQMVEEELPPLKPGEFLAEAVYLSVDPYMRAYAHLRPLGTIMVGTQIAKIIDSQNPNYPIGEYVFGKFDWRSHTISSGEAYKVPGAGYAPAPYILSDFGRFPISYGLGILGMPGTTAYFGFLELCKPKEGETVVVSGAAGAVGCIVGQIAKIKGCKVIGITGSNDKGQFLIKELGFDGFVNYKLDNFVEKLRQLTPNGIDCYFDNVAGEISTTVMKFMNRKGRVSVCGSISSYNQDVENPPKVTVPHPYIIENELCLEGFQNYLYIDRYPEALDELKEWLDENRIKYHETITKGFENMPKVFIEMLNGRNLGKTLVEV